MCGCRYLHESFQVLTQILPGTRVLFFSPPPIPTKLVGHLGRRGDRRFDLVGSVLRSPVRSIWWAVGSALGDDEKNLTPVAEEFPLKADPTSFIPAALGLG